MTGTTVAETQRRGLIAELAELQPVKRTFFAEHRSVQDFHFNKQFSHLTRPVTLATLFCSLISC